MKTEVYTYYKNAKLKDEECPEGSKYCGIIDDNENKLCVLSDSNCPINYFSEHKRDENKQYSSSITIDNKIFYYTFDKEISKNQKIIAGLVADTDLYLNENNDEKVLIDTYTISGFFGDNKNLYKLAFFLIFNCFSVSRRVIVVFLSLLGGFAIILF